VTGGAAARGGSAAALDLGSLGRRSSLSVAGSVVAAVANVLVVVVITRGVDREQAGLFFTVTSLFLLIEVTCRLGTTTGFVYFIPKLRTTGDTRELRPLLAVALLPVLTVSVLAAAAVLVAAPALADLFGADDPAQVATALRILAVFLPVAAAYDSVAAATLGFQDMLPTVLVERVGRPLAQLALVTAALAVGSSALLVPAWAVPYLVALGVSVWALRRDLARTQIESGRLPARPLIGPFWRYTSPRILANMAQIALQRLDIVLVGVLRGPVDAAVYAAATRFLVLGQLGSQAVSQAVQPNLAELLAARDIEGTRQLYQMSTAWLITVTWPVYLTAATLAPIVVGVFGDGYSAGASVVVLLALTMLVATGCGTVDMLLIMAGKTSWNLANVVLALTVNIVLNLLLIPPYGIAGAAAAWAAAILLNNLVPLVQVRRLLGVQPLGAQARGVLCLAAVCFGLVPLAGRAVGGLSAAVAMLLVGGLAYLAVLWRWRVRLHLDELRRRRRLRPDGAPGGSDVPSA
jgi:O-antigen/teichoic acid export membrane protein